VGDLFQPFYQHYSSFSVKKSEESDAETRRSRPPYWLIFKKVTRNWLFYSLHCALAAVHCIVIGPVCVFVCGFVCLCLWVCYHDNSKLPASILTKLGLYVKVVTISSWLNFGCRSPAPPGRGSAAGRIFLAPPYYSQRAVFASLWAFFFIISECGGFLISLRMFF